MRLACDLDTPFDFVQASFVNSPIPSDFGGNILKPAINMMEVWKNVLPGRMLFKELAYMVASCTMLDSTRHGIKVRPYALEVHVRNIESSYRKRRAEFPSIR